MLSDSDLKEIIALINSDEGRSEITDEMLLNIGFEELNQSAGLIRLKINNTEIELTKPGYFDIPDNDHYFWEFFAGKTQYVKKFEFFSDLILFLWAMYPDSVIDIINHQR